MLFAHIVPGYLIGIASQPYWDMEWSPSQRRMLWAAALGSTVVQDVDVVYNTLFRGFSNHSTLYTHSLFPYLALGVLSVSLYALGNVQYIRTMLLLITLGGLSHLVLDIIAHDTPLFYPLTNEMIGSAPDRITKGGIAQYITHPIFLFEPTLIVLGIYFWLRRCYSKPAQKYLIGVMISGWILFTVLYLIFLPTLQNTADCHF